MKKPSSKRGKAAEDPHDMNCPQCSPIKGHRDEGMANGSGDDVEWERMKAALVQGEPLAGDGPFGDYLFGKKEEKKKGTETKTVKAKPTITSETPKGPYVWKASNWPWGKEGKGKKEAADDSLSKDMGDMKLGGHYGVPPHYGV